MGVVKSMRSTTPIVIDPRDYDKDEVFLQSLLVAQEFLRINSLIEPNNVIFEAPKTVSKKEKKAWYDYGLYRFDTLELYVNLNATIKPAITPGYRWSYTGFKTDLTAPGVLAHEIGHHVHNLLSMIHGNEFIMSEARKCRRTEQTVSGYEPNSYETIAEAMRLFILNPELLKEGRPARWNMLTVKFGLRPLHSVPWRDILKNAHPKLITAAENWIRNKKRRAHR